MLRDKDVHTSEEMDSNVAQTKNYAPGHKVMYSYSTSDGTRYIATTIRESGAVYFIDDNGYFIPKANIIAH